MYVRLLDRFLYRRPFEGRSARRYARAERPAFGDLDDRLLDQLDLAGARTLLDLGCGPGTFARRAAARHPGLTVIAVEPSRDFARIAQPGTPSAAAPATRPWLVRASGESLPLADRSIDVAICLSSIRHVRDRAATLAELRRVVAGRVVIVELDPVAEAHRVAAHAERLASRLLRRAFAPLVLRTAPPAARIVELARAAGFAHHTLRPDPIQPVYILELA